MWVGDFVGVGRGAFCGCVCDFLPLVLGRKCSPCPNDVKPCAMEASNHLNNPDGFQ